MTVSRRLVLCSIIGFLAFINLAEGATKLPATFKRCRTDDPNLNGCLRAAVEHAFHQLKNGMENLGVLPIEPLKVDAVNIDQGSSGPVNMVLKLRNITIHGLGETKITNYSASLNEYTLRCTTITPNMRMEFMHTINGRILVLPIRGEGPGSIVLGNLETDHILRSKPIKKKDGRMYWVLDEYIVKFAPKTIALNFDGLFGSDGRFGTQLNAFINQNSQLIFNEIAGSFEDAFGAVFKEITNRVFGRVPINDIFISPKP